MTKAFRPGPTMGHSLSVLKDRRWKWLSKTPIRPPRPRSAGTWRTTRAKLVYLYRVAQGNPGGPLWAHCEPWVWLWKTVVTGPACPAHSAVSQTTPSVTGSSAATSKLSEAGGPQSDRRRRRAPSSPWRHRPRAALASLRRARPPGAQAALHNSIRPPRPFLR